MTWTVAVRNSCVNYLYEGTLQSVCSIRRKTIEQKSWRDKGNGVDSDQSVFPINLANNDVPWSDAPTFNCPDTLESPHICMSWRRWAIKFLTSIFYLTRKLVCSSEGVYSISYCSPFELLLVAVGVNFDIISTPPIQSLFIANVKRSYFLLPYPLLPQSPSECQSKRKEGTRTSDFIVIYSHYFCFQLCCKMVLAHFTNKGLCFCHNLK